MRIPPTSPPGRQQGIALALVMVLLIAVTMLGTTAMRTARIEEQLAGATYDRTVARAASDAGMVDAFQFVYQPGFIPANFTAAPVTSVNDGWTINTWRNLNFDWNLSAQALGAGNISPGVLANVFANPNYAVERLPEQNLMVGQSQKVMRVTVRAVGSRATTESYTMAFVLMPQ